jgi:hypothetical protein
VLIDIHAGRSIPPVTDYLLQPAPEDWNKCLPADLVDSLSLFPIFTDADQYNIYCVEAATDRFYCLDIESPWPPLHEFASGRELLTHILALVRENNPEENLGELQKILAL